VVIPGIPFISLFFGSFIASMFYFLGSGGVALLLDDLS
jgi:hypothetical protein